MAPPDTQLLNAEFLGGLGVQGFPAPACAAALQAKGIRTYGEWKARRMEAMGVCIPVSSMHAVSKFSAALEASNGVPQQQPQWAASPQPQQQTPPQYNNMNDNNNNTNNNNNNGYATPIQQQQTPPPAMNGWSPPAVQQNYYPQQPPAQQFPPAAQPQYQQYLPQPPQPQYGGPTAGFPGAPAAFPQPVPPGQESGWAGVAMEPPPQGAQMAQPQYQPQPQHQPQHGAAAAQQMCTKCQIRPPNPNRKWCQACFVQQDQNAQQKPPASHQPQPQPHHHNNNGAAAGQKMCTKCNLRTPNQGRAWCQNCFLQDKLVQQGGQGGHNAPQGHANALNHCQRCGCRPKSPFSQNGWCNKCELESLGYAVCPKCHFNQAPQHGAVCGYNCPGPNAYKY